MTTTGLVDLDIVRRQTVVKAMIKTGAHHWSHVRLPRLDDAAAVAQLNVGDEVWDESVVQGAVEEMQREDQARQEEREKRMRKSWSGVK